MGISNTKRTVLSLKQHCLLLIDKKHFHILKNMEFELQIVKHCILCNNIVLNIGNITHDIYGNTISKYPLDQIKPICGLLKYKKVIGNIKTIGGFGIAITNIGREAFNSQEKLNNIIYKPILNID